jgi:uncharacterized protein
MNSCIYFGHVMHQRMKPFRHGFRYRVFTLLIDLDELPELQKNAGLLSHNRFNVFISVYDRDHATRDGKPIKDWVLKHARDRNIDLEGGKMYMLCFPRLFGYVFNPLSVYYCRDRTGRLAAMLYEVKNTFGEQHGYLLTAADNEAGPLRHDHPKHFYVSPFIEMETHYHFTVKDPGEKLSVLIRQKDKEGDVLLAAWTGNRAALFKGACAIPVPGFPCYLRDTLAGVENMAKRGPLLQPPEGSGPGCELEGE